MVSPAALSRQRRAQPPAARPYAETFHDRGDLPSHYAWIATAITDSGRGSALSGGSGRMISHGVQPAPCAGCRLHHAGDGTRHHRTAAWPHRGRPAAPAPAQRTTTAGRTAWARRASPLRDPGDRKSTRLNSSHRTNSYAVFCVKKKNKCGRDGCEQQTDSHRRRIGYIATTP